MADHIVGGALRILALLVGLGAGLVLATWLSSCSSGPQLPIVTVPINVACTWHAPDGGAISDCDCLVDRITPSTGTETTGNAVREVQVSPTTSVSAVP